MNTEQSEQTPTGVVEIHLSFEVPVEAIIQGWRRHEIAELLAGNEVARDEMISQAITRRDLWSGWDVIEEDIEVDGKPLGRANAR